MLDIGWSEILVIAVVMIVVVGPKDLPKMLRAFGKATAKLRATANEFRGHFDEALREAELDDVKKTFDDVKKYDPRKTMANVLDPIRSAGEELKSSLNGSPKPATPVADGEGTVVPDKVSAPVRLDDLVSADKAADSANTPVAAADAAPVAKAKPAVKAAAATKPKASAKETPAASKAAAVKPSAKPAATKTTAKPAVAKAVAATNAAGAAGKAKTAAKKPAVKKTAVSKTGQEQ